MGNNENIHIKDLGLTDSAYNPLKRAGIATVGDLIKIPVNRIFCVRSLGSSAFEQIKAKIESLGLSLNENNVDTGYDLVEGKLVINEK